MVDQVSLSKTNLLYNYNSSQKSNQQGAEQIQSNKTVAPEIVDKKYADATKAYALVTTKHPAPEKKSLEEFKTQLITAGKVEGKDFTIEKGGFASKISVLKDGKNDKVYRFNKDGATKEDFESIEEWSYPMDPSKGLKYINTTYDADGKFCFRSTCYEKDKSPYENDIINSKTEPQKLTKYFEENNIKYACDSDLVGECLNFKITAFDSKDGSVARYEFKYDKDNNITEVNKNIIGKDGNLTAEIRYSKDETTYTEFKDSLKA